MKITIIKDAAIGLCHTHHCLPYISYYEDFHTLLSCYTVSYIIVIHIIVHCYIYRCHTKTTFHQRNTSRHKVTAILIDNSRSLPYTFMLKLLSLLSLETLQALFLIYSYLLSIFSLTSYLQSKYWKSTPVHAQHIKDQQLKETRTNTPHDTIIFGPMSPEKPNVGKSVQLYESFLIKHYHSTIWVPKLAYTKENFLNNYTSQFERNLLAKTPKNPSSSSLAQTTM